MENEWHYTDLVKAHRLFVKIEGRYRFYGAYMESRDPDALLRSAKVPLKEALLLFGWVHSWDPNFQGDLAKFLELYESLFARIKLFKGESLWTINLGVKLTQSLEDVFDRVAECNRDKRFESTDASKVLQAIVPDLFVMWDRDIKKGVRRRGLVREDRQRPRDFDGECYACEFMPEMQKWAKVFLDSYVRDKGGDHELAASEISRMTDGITLAKVTDELNYLMHTKRRSLAEIRSISL